MSEEFFQETLGLIFEGKHSRLFKEIFRLFPKKILGGTFEKSLVDIPEKKSQHSEEASRNSFEFSEGISEAIRRGIRDEISEKISRISVEISELLLNESIEEYLKISQ